MTSLSESGRRDFVLQLTILLESNSDQLVAEGYDPADKIAVLKQLSEAAEQAEAKQQELKAQSKKATQKAQQTLAEAYKAASATVELITGLLGKDDALVKEIRKMR